MNGDNTKKGFRLGLVDSDEVKSQPTVTASDSFDTRVLFVATCSSNSVSSLLQGVTKQCQRLVVWQARTALCLIDQVLNLACEGEPIGNETI